MFTLHIKTLTGEILTLEYDLPTAVKHIRWQLAAEFHVSPLTVSLFSLNTEETLWDSEEVTADAQWMVLFTHVFDRVCVEQGKEWQVINDCEMRLTAKRMTHYLCTIQTASSCPIHLCYKYEFFQEVTSGLYYDAVMMDFWGVNQDTREYLVCDTDEVEEDRGVYFSAAWEDLVRAHLAEDAYDEIRTVLSDAHRDHLQSECEHIIVLLAEAMHHPIQRSTEGHVLRQISPFRTGRLVEVEGVWQVIRV